MELNKVKVVIDKETYILSSLDSQKHMEKVARYINNKIEDIYTKKHDAQLNSRLKTLYISLNIADDLFKERQKNKELLEEIEKLKKELNNNEQSRNNKKNA
ncbi:MAG: cell division protein ZapA [Defluviitaleaceae bacterium]|nr:cell division protein ZapA [Defluviitaleaceae bacterium]